MERPNSSSSDSTACVSQRWTVSFSSDSLSSSCAARRRRQDAAIRKSSRRKKTFSTTVIRQVYQCALKCVTCCRSPPALIIAKPAMCECSMDQHFVRCSKLA